MYLNIANLHLHFLIGGGHGRRNNFREWQVLIFFSVGRPLTNIEFVRNTLSTRWICLLNTMILILCFCPHHTPANKLYFCYFLSIRSEGPPVIPFISIISNFLPPSCPSPTTVNHLVDFPHRVEAGQRCHDKAYVDRVSIYVRPSKSLAHIWRPNSSPVDGYYKSWYPL